MDKHQLLDLLISSVVSSNSASFHIKDNVFLEHFKRQMEFTFQEIDKLCDDDLYWLHNSFEKWLKESQEPNPLNINLVDQQFDHLITK